MKTCVWEKIWDGISLTGTLKYTGWLKTTGCNVRNSRLFAHGDLILFFSSNLEIRREDRTKEISRLTGSSHFILQKIFTSPVA